MTMERDDLRVPVFKRIGWSYRPVTEAELSSLGYVKIGVSQSFKAWAEKNGWIRADEFYSLSEEYGWVRRPVCDKCEGSGEGYGDPYFPKRKIAATCPSCGGSGYRRLVAVDDIESLLFDIQSALQAATVIGLRSCRTNDQLNYANHDRLIGEITNILTVIDGENSK